MRKYFVTKIIYQRENAVVDELKSVLFISVISGIARGKGPADPVRAA